MAIAVIVASFGLAAAQAKSLREAEVPAEFPPASFKGKQYVDSRGCVYIRAGIDGLVNWVPRVSRNREVLCGYQPTFAKSAPNPTPERTAKAPVIVPKPAPEAVIKPADTKPMAKPATAAVKPPKKPAVKAVQPRKSKPAAAPKPRRVVKTAPAKPRQPVRRAAAPAPMAKPAAKMAQAAPQATVAAGTTRRVERPRQVTTCKGVRGISRYYAGVDRAGLPVRCGPQNEPYVTVVRREPITVMRDGKPVTVQKRVVRVMRAQPGKKATARTSRQINGNTRVVPRHVWKQQQRDMVNAPVPKGYRPAWTDDRLNTKRAHQTLDGVYASGLAWTRTVPRKLYVRETRRVVTHKYPGLKYPYHSYAEMRAAGYAIDDKGRPIDMTKPPKTMVAQGKKTTKRKAIMATKSARRTAPKAAAAKATAKPRYVQVGMFSVESNARKTAARLQAAGLPARLGTLKKGAKSYRIVLAGPFAQNQVGAALSKARRAGFRDAFVR